MKGERERRKRESKRDGEGEGGGNGRKEFNERERWESERSSHGQHPKHADSVNPAAVYARGD